MPCCLCGRHNVIKKYSVFFLNKFPYKCTKEYILVDKKEILKGNKLMTTFRVLSICYN